MMNTTAVKAGRGPVERHPGEQVSLGSFPTYDEAQSLVDYLADHEFEVETTQIVGSDLRMVEQITGRLNWGRALLYGATSGAWFGVFVGLLLSILSTTSFWRAMVWGLSWGVLFGGIFALFQFAMTAGRRDFTSRSAIIPSRYQVLVMASHGDHARSVLSTR